ncbi:MAG: prepilin-type N-terminal cleavage/methylation domain-containing protein [Ruminococcus sp.]|jgi:prepilin-type N-terminal cleavage/methylation domain-containing protein|nr:prepilin-type N-terminal cleavage/methylation domain-containing protein [Ruminococcus sp.]
MKNTKGFTLIEIIVVIAIIGVLSSILVPSILGYVKRAKETRIKVETRYIYNAATASIADVIMDGEYPLAIDKQYVKNGVKINCGLITNVNIGRAQITDESKYTSANKSDYLIAKGVIRGLDSEDVKWQFYKFSSKSINTTNVKPLNPLGLDCKGMTLKKFHADPKGAGCSGVVIVYDSTGEVILVQYSRSDMLCTYEDSKYTITYEDKGAKFTSNMVKYWKG